MSATAPFQGRRDGMALLVLAKFRQLGPMTVRDAAAACGKRVQHVAPRVCELASEKKARAKALNLAA